jgi:hypothetical protein
MFALLLSTATFSGCNNACQEICGRMKNYAEDCDLTESCWSDEQVDQCLEEQAEATKDELKVCRQNGSAEDIRNTWTCEDLADNCAGGAIPPPVE